MTDTELTVYGKRTGSLWDRRIGGRYELVAITDNAGLGVWVTLERVDGGHELAMSVHNLGRNYVCVPEKAEPAEPAERERTCAGCGKTGRDLDGNDWCEACAPLRPDLPSADVPLAAWEIEHLNRERPIEQFDGVDFGDLIRIGGEALYRVVDADGKAILEPEPAPTPPLPWVEHPDAWWWLPPNPVGIYRSEHMANAGDGAPLWQRVAVIPWQLIEELRTTWSGSTVIDAILDAADGVTS